MSVDDPQADDGQDPGPEAGAFERAGTSASEERRKQRQRAKRQFGPDVTDLNLIPIMGLFTAMVLYLLKSYASDPVQIQPSPETRLPESSSTLAPQEAVQVAISDKVILVNDKLVARVQNGRVSAEYKKNNDPAQMFIEPLYNSLRDEADRQKMFAKYNQKKKELQFKGLLTIIGDKSMPFRILTEVLYTAGKAQYGAYKFAVIKKES